jgi:hypothetical protein
MAHQFVCPACGHVTVYDPARCPWHMVARPDGAGGTERRFYRRVRCPRCQREERVPAEPTESGRRDGVRGIV